MFHLSRHDDAGQLFGSAAEPKRVANPSPVRQVATLGMRLKVPSDHFPLLSEQEMEEEKKGGWGEVKNFRRPKVMLLLGAS